MLFHILNVITAYRPNYLSKKIKKETKEIHDKIEKHSFFLDLIARDLPDFKYALYLQNLLPIYKAVEMFLFTNNNNNEIVQSRKIEEDLKLYSRHLNLKFDLPQYKFYSEWLEYFFNKEDFYKKTELYVRWLADLYGGQIIKKYLRFGNKYEFKNVRGDIQQVRKQIEEDLTDTNVDRFIEETKKTYQFHTDIVNKIYECTEESLRNAQSQIR